MTFSGEEIPLEKYPFLNLGTQSLFIMGGFTGLFIIMEKGFAYELASLYCLLLLVHSSYVYFSGAVSLGGEHVISFIIQNLLVIAYGLYFFLKRKKWRLDVKTT